MKNRMTTTLRPGTGCSGGPFRVGILGAGRIAGKMAMTLRQMDGVQAYGIASRCPDRAREFAEKNGITKAYGSYEEMMDDDSLDLIYVATPHSLHFPHVKACLEHGRAVLCEKSFMLNAREAAEAIRISEEKGVFLAEAIWSRYLPFSRTVRDLIDCGRIGHVRSITADLSYPVLYKERVHRPELGGGALLDLGVYLINFALMMFGDDFSEIVSTCALSESGVDLQESIGMKWQDGKMASLSASVLCASDRQAIIRGDGGYIVLDNVNNPLKADIYSSSHVLEETLIAPEQITGFEYQVRACIDAIAAGKVEPDCMPHSESLRVMKTMDGLRQEWGVSFPGEDMTFSGAEASFRGETE